MENFIAKIKDLNEQLIATGKVIPDNTLVQILLDALLDSYQTFASNWRLIFSTTLNGTTFDDLNKIVL